MWSQEALKLNWNTRPTVRVGEKSSISFIISTIFLFFNFFSLRVFSVAKLLWSFFSEKMFVHVVVDSVEIEMIRGKENWNIRINRLSGFEIFTLVLSSTSDEGKVYCCERFCNVKRCKHRQVTRSLESGFKVYLNCLGSAPYGDLRTPGRSL